MAEDSADGAQEHDGGHETQAATRVSALEHMDVGAAAHELGAVNGAMRRMRRQLPRFLKDAVPASRQRTGRAPQARPYEVPPAL